MRVPGPVMYGEEKETFGAMKLETGQNLSLSVPDATEHDFRWKPDEGFGDCDKGGLIRACEKGLGVEFRKRK